MIIPLIKNKFNCAMITSILVLTLSLSACAKVTEITANDGDAEAQFKMGMYYFDGNGGVSTDFYKAADWFQKSAAQGYNPAELALGEAYGKGRGVRQSHQEALIWIQKSATQGYAPAQVTLGHIFNRDIFFEDYPENYKNRELAKEWFGRACDSGNQEGCNGYRKLNE